MVSFFSGGGPGVGGGRSAGARVPMPASGSVCVYQRVNTDVTARQPKTFLDGRRDEEKTTRRSRIFLGGGRKCDFFILFYFFWFSANMWMRCFLFFSSPSLLISHPVVTDVC